MKPLVPDDSSVLIAHLERNQVIQAILARVEELELPNWYLGAGCIPQTVWNALHGFSATDHIRDYDVPYFDAADTSYEAENRRIRHAENLFADLPVTIELRNQARVHVWYEGHFGYPIEAYKSVEDAIGSWPTTATAIGIRGIPGGLAVYAPFGLGAVLGMVARPNKRQITREIYVRKISRWRRCWHKLVVVDWETGLPMA
jgi:uncharacterized protein